MEAVIEFEYSLSEAKHANNELNDLVASSLHVSSFIANTDIKSIKMEVNKQFGRKHNDKE